MNGDDFAVHLAEVDQRSRSNTHRLDAMEQTAAALNKLATSVEVMAAELKRQGEDVDEIKRDVTNIGGKVHAMEVKPGKRWEGIVDKLIWGVIGVIAGAAGSALLQLLKMGLGG